MIEVVVELNTRQVREALKRVPDRLFENLHDAVLRAAIEMARSGKKHAPKAHSTLASSIRHMRTELLEYVIEPGVNYGLMAASQTGPQRMPSVLSIYDWVRVKRLRPRNPRDTQEDLAWSIARSIAKRGTAENDYMGRAVRDTSGRLRELINQATDKSLVQAGFRD